MADVTPYLYGGHTYHQQRIYLTATLALGIVSPVPPDLGKPRLVARASRLTRNGRAFSAAT